MNNYNAERPHSSLNYLTHDEMFYRVKSDGLMEQYQFEKQTKIC